MPNSGRPRSDDPGCLARLVRQGPEHAALPSAHEADASTSRTERLAIKPSARCDQRQSGGMGQTAGVIATPEKVSFFEATLNNPHADLLQRGPIGGRRRNRRSAFPAGDPRHVEPPTARVRRPLNRSGDATGSRWLPSDMIGYHFGDGEIRGVEQVQGLRTRIRYPRSQGSNHRTDRRLVMLKVTTPQDGRVAHRGLDDIITTTSALWGLRTI